jgi:RES domain-containing protein
MDLALLQDVMQSELISRNFGLNFLRELSAVVQTVPSVVVHQEMNYLINPEHPEFDAVSWGEQQPFSFDKRLIHADLR